MFQRIFEILSIPIILLNFLGGIIAGIWLAFLGEWQLIGIGVLFLMTSHWYLSLLILPGLGIAGISMYLFERKNPFANVFMFLTQFYTNALMVLTCVFAFIFCSSFYLGEIGFGYIPYLLWSWGMALGPWQFFASKEPDNEFSAITLGTASIFYFVFITSIFFSPFFGFIIIVLFGVVQLIVLPIFLMYLENQTRDYY